MPLYFFLKIQKIFNHIKLSLTDLISTKCLQSHLLVAQQVRGRAGVEQSREDVANPALELPLQHPPPLGRMAFGALGARVGNAFWQLR